jgi:hypothetical protein
MSSFAAHILVSTLRGRLLAGGVVAGFLAVTLIPSFSVAAPVEDSIPQLGSRDFGWNVNFWDFQLDPPLGSAHGPIKTDPNYPYNSQIQNGDFFCRWGAPSPDREHEGSDLKTLGCGADAGNERRGAERQEAASLHLPIALLARGRAWPTPFSPTHVFHPDAERSMDG